MDSLPLVLTTILQTFRPFMRAEVFTSFGYLLTGLLIGEVKAGTVRASVFAPANYWPQRKRSSPGVLPSEQETSEKIDKRRASPGDRAHLLS